MLDLLTLLNGCGVRAGWLIQNVDELVGDERA